MNLLTCRNHDLLLPDINMGLEGWFTVRAIKNGRIVRECEFPTHNLITNLGLDRIGSESAAATYRYCHVGTGTTPPAFTDSQLANFHGLVSATAFDSNGSGAAPDYYAWRRIEWTSAVGALGNVVLTEVGVSGTNVNGMLFSRDLIKDSGGNPSTFPLASDEQLSVTYELRFYPKVTDTLATVQVGPNTHDTITRPMRLGSTSWQPLSSANGARNFFLSTGSIGALGYTGDLGPVTGTPLGTGISSDSGNKVTDPYVNGNHYLDCSAKWGSGAGAFTMRSVGWGFTACQFQVQYDPPIVKTANESLTLRQRISWGRR